MPQKICSEEGETRKICSAAFLALSSGTFLASLVTSSEAARKYFEDVPDLEKYRRSALNLLVSRNPLTDEMPDVLRSVVETGRTLRIYGVESMEFRTYARGGGGCSPREPCRNAPKKTCLE